MSLWLGQAEPLPDHHQQLERYARRLTHFVERDSGKAGEPIEGTHVEKGERESSPSNSGGHLIERYPGPFQTLYPTSSAHVTRRENVSFARRQDPELDQSIDVTDLDPGLPSHLVAGVITHRGDSTVGRLRHIVAKGGNDTIHGEGGKDIICAGIGADTIYGDGGADAIFGGDGKDEVFAGAGNDTVVGGLGKDTLHGGAGADALEGKDGADTLRGGDGADDGFGGTGDNTCIAVEQRTSCKLPRTARRHRRHRRPRTATRPTRPCASLHHHQISIAGTCPTSPSR